MNRFILLVLCVYYRGKIIELIEANKVVVLSGETGCGKTTQVITMQLTTTTTTIFIRAQKLYNTDLNTRKKKITKEKERSHLEIARLITIDKAMCTRKNWKIKYINEPVSSGDK